LVGNARKYRYAKWKVQRHEEEEEEVRIWVILWGDTYIDAKLECSEGGKKEAGFRILLVL
jgi:hypothetical protein